MPTRRRINDEDPYAQFITFSCYRRRRLLDCEPLRDTLIASLTEKLKEEQGICSGYVIMPDHVHLIVWLEATGSLSTFMKRWKQSSSIRLKKMLRGLLPEYANKFPQSDPFWQPKYHAFSLYSQEKAEEKLDYMHMNPVSAGLVESAIDWRWSSARFYQLNESNVVPLKWIFD